MGSASRAEAIAAAARAEQAGDAPSLPPHRLPTGRLREVDRADFMEVTDLQSFQVRRTWLAGQLVSRGEGLKAGQIVMTGSVMKTIFPSESASYRFDLAGIGAVVVEVQA